MRCCLRYPRQWCIPPGALCSSIASCRAKKLVLSLRQLCALPSCINRTRLFFFQKRSGISLLRAKGSAISIGTAPCPLAFILPVDLCPAVRRATWHTAHARKAACPLRNAVVAMGCVFAASVLVWLRREERSVARASEKFAAEVSMVVVTCTVMHAFFFLRKHCDARYFPYARVAACSVEPRRRRLHCVLRKTHVRDGTHE